MICLFDVLCYERGCFSREKNLVREKLYEIARRADVPRLMGYLSRRDLIGDVIV